MNFILRLRYRILGKHMFWHDIFKNLFNNFQTLKVTDYVGFQIKMLTYPFSKQNYEF